MITLIILIFLFSTARCPERHCVYIEKTEAIQPYEAIWNAVCAIESSGDRYAYHLEDNGTESLGIVQIQDIRVREYNQLTGQNLKHTDVYDFEISKMVFTFYAHRYGPYRIDEFVRSWNGKGKATYQYLAKVKAKLNTN